MNLVHGGVATADPDAPAAWKPVLAAAAALGVEFVDIVYSRAESGWDVYLMPVAKHEGHDHDDDHEEDGGESEDCGDPHCEYCLLSDPGYLKKDAPKRFTLAPWYIPDSVDAHGEWADTPTVQQALWGYVRNGDRQVRLQHDVSVVAGEWVEAVTWPVEVTLPMHHADGRTTVEHFPKGTVFLGVVWEPWAWELVQKGKLTGLSIGGKAVRVNDSSGPAAVAKYSPPYAQGLDPFEKAALADAALVAAGWSDLPRKWREAAEAYGRAHPDA
jgi:Putative phage serine protease XkdF